MNVFYPLNQICDSFGHCSWLGDIAGYIYRIDGGEDDDSYHIPDYEFMSLSSNSKKVHMWKDSSIQAS